MRCVGLLRDWDALGCVVLLGEVAIDWFVMLRCVSRCYVVLLCCVGL